MPHHSNSSKKCCKTLSGTEVKQTYSTEDIGDFEPSIDFGKAGNFPYTRGIYSEMYQNRLWAMRQFSGFGTPEQTNSHYLSLLARDQTELSVAFDLPTLMGYDSDDPRVRGEVGKCGVAISSLADMEILFDKIPLADVATSITATSSGAILWAMYLAVAEQQKVNWSQLSGTVRNDILKEYIYPPHPSMRLVIDMLEFGMKHTPRFNPASISGYHIREAGATARQELAYTLATGIEYVRLAVERGIAVDQFAPRLSFFFDTHSDFFEEIAKFRAARKVWAKVMRNNFGAENPQSWKLRFHAQTSCVSLTAQQPQINLVRTTLQTMAAVLGGTQSLHANALDEAYSLPTEDTVLLALRTQQVIAHETNVKSAVDPTGGSYFIERLTLDMEQHCFNELEKIDAMGGIIAAVERGHLQSEITQSSHEFERVLEQQERFIVGINTQIEDSETPVPTFQVDQSVVARQTAALVTLRHKRDSREVTKKLNHLRQIAKTNENLMPFILETVKSYATLGEICGVLKEALRTRAECVSA